MIKYLLSTLKDWTSINSLVVCSPDDFTLYFILPYKVHAGTATLQHQLGLDDSLDKYIDDFSHDKKN